MVIIYCACPKYAAKLFSIFFFRIDSSVDKERNLWDFLDLPINVQMCDVEDYNDALNLCGKVGGKKSDNIDFIKDISYWQVWQERFGFVPDMSIFDLLMTHGRESILVLRDMVAK